MSPRNGLHRILQERWSPRAYLDQPIAPEDLATLFEAARWASSCFNEQPWRFVTAVRSDPASFERVLSLLGEKNQAWAKGAWLIGFTAGKRTFTHNGSPNRFGLHDVAAAGACLAIQATSMGLQAHFMGGFDAARAKAEFGVPDDFEVGAAFVVGYPAEFMPPAERQRKPVGELVFSGQWGEVAAFLQ